MATIVLRNVDENLKKELEQKLKETSLNKICLIRQLIKKFIYETDSTIDFLFK